MVRERKLMYISPKENMLKYDYTRWSESIHVHATDT